MCPMLGRFRLGEVGLGWVAKVMGRVGFYKVDPRSPLVRFALRGVITEVKGIIVMIIA